MTNPADNLTGTASEHPDRPAIEVEDALHEHDAVAEVAVVGIPHDDLGEQVGRLPQGATGKSLRREVSAPEEQPA